MLLDKIEELCSAKGISIARLEKECGLGNATIRGWNNSAPNTRNLMRVAKYFDVPFEELICLIPEKKEKQASGTNEASESV